DDAGGPGRRLDCQGNGQPDRLPGITQI
ncbi:uncharacterized protein METZ01_LOCUS160256, partial [marine metagenome]